MTTNRFARDLFKAFVPVLLLIGTVSGQPPQAGLGNTPLIPSPSESKVDARLSQGSALLDRARIVLADDKTPRDLGVIRPGRKVKVRVPIVNTCEHNILISSSSTSCLCTSVHSLTEVFTPGVKSFVEFTIDSGKQEGEKPVSVDLQFREESIKDGSIVATASFKFLFRVKMDCSWSGGSLRFNGASQKESLFVTNFGSNIWKNLWCDTGHTKVAVKCFLQETVSVENEFRQVGRIELELVGVPSGSEFRETVGLHLFAQHGKSGDTYVEVSEIDVDVIRSSRFEIVPRQLNVGVNDEEVSFFVISNDESFPIDDQKLEVFVQPSGSRIEATKKKISPRWVRVAVQSKLLREANEVPGEVGIEVKVLSNDFNLEAAAVLVFGK